MAYNRINHLKKVIRVHEIYSQHKDFDVTNRWIFNRYVKDVYHISESTFYLWLAVKNPKKQLEKLMGEKSDKANKGQIKINFQ